MLHHLFRLLKDYNFYLRVGELILACISMKILSGYEEYTVPRWLWIIYCINTTTYTVIFFVLFLAHVFQKQRIILTFTYLTLGIVLHWISGISGIVRAHFVIPEDSDSRQSELTIGIIFLCTSVLMATEIISKIYTDIHQIEDNDESHTSVAL